MLPAGTVLLVSGFGDDGYGGLFACDGSTVTQLDDLPTTGVSVDDGRIARALRTADDPARPAEILVYDETGLTHELTVDAPDPHDLVSLGRTYALVSSLTNSVVQFSDRGQIIGAWTAPGEGDAWHLNGLTVVDGDWVVTAFGEFSRHREWQIRGCEGTGFIRHLSTGRDVVGGLSSPHHPRFVDGHWFVCNSSANEVLELDPRAPQMRRALDLGRFTRGLAITRDHLFVGISGGRTDREVARAQVVVADRRTLGPVLDIDLPCGEIYDLSIASTRLAEGIARSPRRKPPRRLARLERLSPGMCRLRVSGELPTVVATDDIVAVDCAITNEAETTVGSVGPFPVHVGYRWERAGVSAAGSTRAKLPRPLGPGESATVKLALITPAAPGGWRLTITGVQEQVAWFDELDPDSAWSTVVKAVDELP